jgi:hypothetical protein
MEWWRDGGMERWRDKTVIFVHIPENGAEHRLEAHATLAARAVE